MSTCELVTTTGMGGDRMVENNGVTGAVLLGGMGSLTAPAITRTETPKPTKAKGPKHKPTGVYNYKPSTEAGNLHEGILKLASEGIAITKNSLAELTKLPATRCQGHLRAMVNKAVMVEVTSGVFALVSK